MSLISIIIPAYNSMEYLPDAIQSVLNQTFTNYKIIVVNDGSTDKTAQWVSQVSDSRIHLISQPNRGKSAARNAGIKAAQTKYIAFLDADDIWEETKLERQLNYLENHPEVGLVYTWTDLADHTGQSIGRTIKPTAEGNVWLALVQSNILVCGSTPLIRTDCFKQVGLFDPMLLLSQDWDMWIRLAAKYKFGIIRLPLVFYRQHTGNTSKNWRKMQIYNTRVLEQALKDAPIRFRVVIDDIRYEALSSLFIYLGWLAFHNAEYGEAYLLWQKAHQNARQRMFSRESIRLGFSITLGQLLGATYYNRLSKFIYYARRQFSS